LVMEKQDSTRPKRRLGFKEIVPGRDNDASDEKTTGPGVPQFDLDRQVMAKPRKVVGATRKRPQQPKGEASPRPSDGLPSGGRRRETGIDKDGVSQRRPTDALQGPVNGSQVSGRVWCPAMTEAQRRVIAQIVARDIDRLCHGERVFGT